HILTSAYHPRSNDLIERFDRLFDDEYVDHALLACRIRQYYVTGETPFYMIYGVEVKLPGNEQVPIINYLVQQR
ncbi:unnamed protein product, partial [Rotaria sordida]